MSLLVMLNLPAILTGATGMDQYGFFTLEPVAARPWPLVLSIAVSASAAGTGYLAYRLLQRRAWFAGNRYEAYHRNAVLFGVPVGIAFAPCFLLAGHGDKPAIVAVGGIMATSLCITAALDDRETRLDPGTARTLFVAGLAFILVFLAFCLSAMLVMHLISHSPSTGNFFWTWEFAWRDLGYPEEEFSQRYRNGLLAFTLAASCYMTVALGGSLLGAILGWTRPGMERSYRRRADAATLEQPGQLPEGLEAPTPPPDQPVFVMVMNGEETAISRSRYENLLAEKDSLLPGAGLLVDKAAGTAFARTVGKWRKLSFRARRSGPFLLLCVYARNPGRRFHHEELEVLLRADLSGRDGFNVGDFIAQLRRRGPLVPVQRDADGSYIPETVGVCFLDYHLPSPPAADETGPSQDDSSTGDSSPGR